MPEPKHVILDRYCPAFWRWQRQNQAVLREVTHLLDENCYALLVGDSMILDIHYSERIDRLNHELFPLAGKKLTARSPMPRAASAHHKSDFNLNNSIATEKATGLQKVKNFSNMFR